MDDITRTIQNLGDISKHSISCICNQTAFKIHDKSEEQLQAALKILYIYSLSSREAQRCFHKKLNIGKEQTNLSKGKNIYIRKA